MNYRPTSGGNNLSGLGIGCQYERTTLVANKRTRAQVPTTFLAEQPNKVDEAQDSLKRLLVKLTEKLVAKVDSND